MKVFQEQCRADDGLALHVYRWVPPKAHAAIVLAHGWSEHAGRYDNLARWFAGQGYEVHALDHRGHGKSEGSRGHVVRWSDYARDLEQVRQSVETEHQYLMGHSMGGMISLLHLLNYPNRFRAVALSGPAADVSYPVPKYKVWLSKALSTWVPTLSLSNDIDASIVCANEEVVQSYANDPYTHGKVTARWFVEYLKTIKRVRHEAPSISTPLAIWHGEGDALVEPWVSERLYDNLSMNHRKRQLVQGALHEILFEKSWQQTADEMRLWLEQF